jgi:lysophospholipase L1-like esterase
MEHKICIFGASSTQGFYDIKKGGWVDRLKIYLYERSLNTNDYYEVFNLRVSGNTSRDLLKRFYNEAKARNPTIIIVSLGDNDSGFKIPLEEYETNMDKILSQAKEFTQNIIVLGAKKVNEKLTNPVPWNKEASYINAEIKKYDGKLKGLAEKHKVEFVPLIDVLNDKDLEDGIHPNSKGHKKLFGEVKKILKKKKLI